MNRLILAMMSALVLIGATQSPSPSPDPAALSAVTRYVQALVRGDYRSAYGLLTNAQQRYFIDVNNFASNNKTTDYHIRRFSVLGAVSHGAVVEVVVHQDISVLDRATGRNVDGKIREPYFALRENGAWRVKQLYQPWKAYAPQASASSQSVTVTVDRIEFYDQRLRFDCRIRNDGSTPVQILPLNKSTLDDGSGSKIAALDTATFPLNDVGFFEGVRLSPGAQTAGFINFPVTHKADETQSFTLALGPAIFDGAEQTFSIVVGPIRLEKL